MASLSVRRHGSVDAFEAVALPLLLEHEAENNLFIAICGQINVGRYTDFYLATVEREGEVVAAAFCTPPFKLGFSHLADTDALEALEADVALLYPTLTGVQGEPDKARRFAELWRERSGQDFEVEMKQRIYRVTEVEPPVANAGSLRRATMKDIELVTEWIEGFAAEVEPQWSDAREIAEWRLSGAGGPIFLWETDRPVSMAGARGPTPNGIAINAVFTPPELRNNGYATACVAAVTQRMLDEGRRFCFLYTNLANPTSNSIYQKIGYRPLVDVDVIRFAT
jgi:uncharacterized protein